MVRRPTKYRKRKKPLPGQRLSRQQQYEHVLWKEFSYRIFVRDNFTCQARGCKGGCKELHCHHIRYIQNRYIWQVPENLCITVCADCHSRIHGRDLHKIRRKNKPPTKPRVKDSD